MAIDLDEVRRELDSLRKGPGIQRADVLKRIGPQLRQVFGIYQHDTAPRARAKITSAVEELLRGEPNGVLLAVLVGLAAHPMAVQPTLGDRVLRLAARQQYQPRTARRRIDEGFDVLVRAIQANHNESMAGHADGWWVRSLVAVLRLNAPDGTAPAIELTERRQIVFAEDGVEELRCEFSLPRANHAADTPHDLQIDVVFGGGMRERHRPALQHFVYTIELPRRFRAGESHDYLVRYRLPEGQPIVPHYVLQPFVPYESFEVTVCFDVDRLPRVVWQLDGVAPRVLETAEVGDRILEPDRFGQVRSSFYKLSQGRGYGIKWLH